MRKKIDQQMAKIKLFQEELKLILMGVGTFSSIAAFLYNLFHGKLLNGNDINASEKITRVVVKIPEHVDSINKAAQPLIHRSGHWHLANTSYFEIALIFAIGVIVIGFMFFFFKSFKSVLDKHMKKG